MRICRFSRSGEPLLAFYFDDFILPLDRAAQLLEDHTHRSVDLSPHAALLDYLPPDGARSAAAAQASCG